VSSNREIAIVQADYLALANDLEQAQSLASTLELQLSGKTNELARFKLIWERAQADLAKFENDINAMRKERHELANKAQRGYAYEHKYEKLKVEHDQLTERAARLESELTRERAAYVNCRVEMEDLRVRASARSEMSANDKASDPELTRAMELLRDQLDRVLGKRTGAEAPAPQRGLKTAAAERIDIEFEP
jgi:chromosome segregation ATPase